MTEKRKPFLTLGKSTFSKIANSIALILLLGFVVVKFGLVSPSITSGFEYTIPANELQVKTQEELASRLSDYSTNMELLELELKKAGIGFNEFKTNVSMEVVISTSQNRFNGLVVEFKSTLPREKLKPIFNFITNDIKNHVKYKKG